ncbi:hypothetical protein KCV01_g11381, partial [Aureobasidium melanogenum]
MIFIATDNAPIVHEARQLDPVDLAMEDAENIAATAWLQWRSDKDFERFCADRHASPSTLTAYPNGTFSLSTQADGATTEWHFRPFYKDGRLLPPISLDQGTTRWTSHAAILLQYARHLNRPVDRHSVGISRINGLATDRMLEKTGPVTTDRERLLAAHGLLKVFASLYSPRPVPDLAGGPPLQARFNFDLEKFARRFDANTGLRHLSAWVSGVPNDDISAMATLKILEKLAMIVTNGYAMPVDLQRSALDRDKAAFRRAFRHAAAEVARRNALSIDAANADFAANALYAIRRQRMHMGPLNALPPTAPQDVPTEEQAPAISLPPPNPDTGDMPAFTERPLPRPASEPGTTSEDTQRWVRVAEIMTIHGTVLVFTAGSLTSLTASQKAAITALGSGIVAAGGTVLAVAIPAAGSVAGAAGSTAIFYGNIVDYLISRGVAPKLAKSAAVVEIGGVYVLVGVGTVQSGNALAAFAHHRSWRNALAAFGHVIATIGTLGAGAASADKADRYNIDDARYGFFVDHPELPGKLEHAGSGASVVGVGTLYAADNIPSTPDEAPTDQGASSFWRAMATLASYWDPSGIPSATWER